MEEGTLRLLGILILLLPASATLVAGALGARVLKGAAHWPVIVGVGGAALASAVLLHVVAGASADECSATVGVYDWFSAVVGSWFQVEFLIDPLAAIMLVTVTFISLLVVIYSRDYMRHNDHPERGYERFFAFLALFVFSMCALVLGGNFVLLYLGWEAVGLCSYLLIGFYYQKPSAAAAAKKAFLVNRIGDFGFGVGILLIFLTFGVLDYHSVFEATRQALAGNVGELASTLEIGLADAEARMALITARLPIIALLLFCGAVGKSAQFPLYVWLPDAMEGPSPVSALIHAATMDRRCVYDGALWCDLHRFGRRDDVRGDHRGRHGAVRGHHCPRTARHEAHSGVLHYQSVRIYVPGCGSFCGQFGHLSSIHARVLQGSAVSCRGQCDARHGGDYRRAPVRRSAAHSALDFSNDAGGSSRVGGLSPVGRFLEQG